MMTRGTRLRGRAGKTLLAGVCAAVALTMMAVSPASAAPSDYPVSPKPPADHAWVPAGIAPGSMGGSSNLFTTDTQVLEVPNDSQVFGTQVRTSSSQSTMAQRWGIQAVGDVYGQPAFRIVHYSASAGTTFAAIKDRVNAANGVPEKVVYLP